MAAQDLPAIDFPIRLSSGETLADKAALDQYLETQKKRAAGNGYSAKVAAYHLEQLNELKLIEK